jgi:hypothetical protein
VLLILLERLTVEDAVRLPVPLPLALGDGNPVPLPVTL